MTPTGDGGVGGRGQTLHPALACTMLRNDPEGAEILWLVEQPFSSQQSIRVWFTAHEIDEELQGIFGVTPAEYFVFELAAGFGIEQSFLFESSKGIGIERLGPFIGIITGGITVGSEKR